MLRPKLLQAVLLIMLATAVLTAHASFVQAASEECRARPDFSAPAGSHWYYRIDRIGQRRCWFLRSGDFRIGHFSSLRRRDSINRNIEPEIQEQSKLDGTTAGGLTPIQDPAVLSDEPMQGESAAPEFDAETSERLVPHQVATISFTRPRVEEQSLGRESNFDLLFFGGAFATGLLIAAGVFQIIDRFNRSPRTASSKPVPQFATRRSQNIALSSKGNLKKVRERFGGSNNPAPQPIETLLRHRQLH
jgi:hypothetical protein